MVQERFEALLTVDQNFEFQQNLRASGVGVVMVLARANRLKELRPLVPEMLDALAKVTPGALALANMAMEPVAPVLSHARRGSSPER